MAKKYAIAERVSCSEQGFQRPYSTTAWIVARCGAALAVACAVFSRGYVHPDECFQSVEIGARDVLGAEIFVPWEWGGHEGAQLAPKAYGEFAPCRSVAFAAFAAHLPLSLCRLFTLGFVRRWELIRVLPRLWACLVSLAVDPVALEVWRSVGLTADQANLARVLHRTSWPGWLLLTRPFSNAFEANALAVAAHLSLVTPRPLLLGCLTAIASFARVTFLAFALPLGAFLVLESASPFKDALRGLAGYAGVGSTLFLADSWYHGLYKLTPLANLRFNMDRDNLRQFGLHFRGTHLLLNLPLLYGPLVGMVIFTSRKQGHSRRKMGALLASAGLGFVALSSAPHQEARFLLPMWLAVCACGSVALTRTRRKRLFCAAWLLHNIAVGGFFATIHQAGVTPALRYAAERTDQRDHVAFVGCYMPPRSLLLGTKIKAHDWQEAATVAALAARLDLIPARNETLSLAVSGSVDLGPMRELLASRGARLRRVATFAPHFSGEFLPRRPKDLHLGLYDLVDDAGAAWRLTTTTPQEASCTSS